MKTASRLCMMSLLLIAPVLFAEETVTKDGSQKSSDISAPNETTDQSITQAIRAAIEADRSLSTTAQSIKIITQGGWVNLKGPVRTREERLTIEAKAIEVVGRLNVLSQLEVAPVKASVAEEPYVEETPVPVKSDDPKHTR